MSQSLGIVIPAYRPDLDELIPYVYDLDKQLKPSKIQIELDSPSEGVVEQLSDLPATVSTVPYRRGKGAAITAGFEDMKTDILAFVDADGATPASEMALVVDGINEYKADIITGSRRHPDANVVTHQTFTRRRLGDAFAWLARRMLPIKLYDYQCGAKAITADSWELLRVHLYESGFAWDIELITMADALDLNVVEVPIKWYDRSDSTVSTVQTPVELAHALFTIHNRAKQLNNSRLHSALATWRESSETIVEKE